MKEALEQELIHRTFNYQYNQFYPFIFPEVKSVELRYCNSTTTRLVRAADIIANRVYFLARSNQFKKIDELPNLHNIYLP